MSTQPNPAGGDEKSRAAATDEISSVQRFIEILATSHSGEDLSWFRGQAKSAWALTPSLLRPPRSANEESVIVKRFQQNAVRFLATAPETEWDWQFLMQHHGAPTRLLDWSENPLMALWFAVEDDAQLAVEGSLWILRPLGLNTISGIEFETDLELPCFDIDTQLDSYLPSAVQGKEANDSILPLAGICLRKFERVYAQHGAFTISYKSSAPVDRDGSDAWLTRYSVPAASKLDIRRQLNTLRINRLSAFPDLDSAAELSVEGL